jgi:hypothetical protein
MKGGVLARDEASTFKRITVLTANAFERELHARAAEFGAISYLCMYCSGKRISDPFDAGAVVVPLVRVEILADAGAAERMIAFLREHRAGPFSVTATVEPVDVPVGV